MRMLLETLEPRDLPSASLLNGVLSVTVRGAGDRTVSVDRVGDKVQVTEDGRATLFAAADVTSLSVTGSATARNVIQNNTNLPGTLLGGPLGDTIFGGPGANVIDAGAGIDVVYALLGSNTINSRDSASDRVFTNAGANVAADSLDVVAKFFAPGRTPGVPFIGVDSASGVLYVTPGNAGSRVVLQPGVNPGEVVAVYNLLSPNSPLRVQTFTGVKAVAYFGGAGKDLYVNNTDLAEAAYGSAGDDFLVSGFGDALLKGSGGNDVLLGRGKSNDLSGNGGADLLWALNGARNVFRVDPLDTVRGRKAGDVVLTP